MVNKQQHKWHIIICHAQFYTASLQQWLSVPPVAANMNTDELSDFAIQINLLQIKFHHDTMQKLQQFCLT